MAHPQTGESAQKAHNRNAKILCKIKLVTFCVGQGIASLSLMKRNLLVIVFVNCLIMFAPGCTESRLVRYGNVPLTAPSGEKIYFRREVRGRNFDEVILSPNPEPCVPPDSAGDLIFPDSDPTIYFKFEGQVLHLYPSVLAPEPSQAKFATRIVQHFLTNPERIKLRAEYQAKGLILLEIPFDNQIKCP